MNIAILQMSPTKSDAPRTLRRVAELLGECRGADMVCLPEIWTPGYCNFQQWAEQAEPIPGPTTEWLADRARELNCILHGGTIVERDGDRLFNTAVVLDRDGSLLGSYRKIHLFSHAGREKDLVAAGEDIVCVDTRRGRVGLAICYDLRFPEMFRGLLDCGAEMFIVPAAWRKSALDDWRLLCRARALENQCFLIAAAVCGEGGGMQFPGHGMVVNPTGRIVAEAGEDEMILRAEIDPALVAQVRRDFPVLGDRR